MKRFIISGTAILVGAIIIIAHVTVASAAVAEFISDNRTVLGLCAVVLTVTPCVTVGSRAGLPAAPREAPEQCSRF